MIKYKKILLPMLITLLVILVAGYCLFELSKSRTFQLFGGLTSHVDTNQKIVALTFDDAPTSHSDEVLKILAEKNIHATFYAIGQSLEKYPDQAKAIVQQGNELGNHSYSHERFILKSPSFIKNEIEKTNQLIRNAGYIGEITFRPPYGKKLIGLPWYLHENNIKTIMWDVEPDTYYPSNAELIKKHTIENTKPGSIIVLHPFCENECAADREALPQIIDELQSKGYSFVTISKLLQP